MNSSTESSCTQNVLMARCYQASVQQIESTKIRELKIWAKILASLGVERPAKACPLSLTSGQSTGARSSACWSEFQASDDRQARISDVLLLVDDTVHCIPLQLSQLGRYKTI